MYRITYLVLLLPMYCILGFYAFTEPNMIAFGLLLFVLFFDSFVIFSKKSSFMNLFIYYMNSIIVTPVSLFILFEYLGVTVFLIVTSINMVLNFIRMFIEPNKELEYLLCLIYCLFFGVSELYLYPIDNSLEVVIYIFMLNFVCIPNFKKLIMFKMVKKNKKKKIKEI